MYRIKSSLSQHIRIVLTLSIFALFAGCEATPEQSAPFLLEDWNGVWKGVQSDYAMKDAAGNIIYIQGQEAQVKSSTFTFSIDAGGEASLSQSVADGRLMQFQGRWKAIPSMIQLDRKTKQQFMLGISCELSASSGAYRNYILQMDTLNRSVICQGTPREPLFELARVSEDNDAKQ